MAVVTRPFASNPPARPHASAGAPLRRCTFRRVELKVATARALPTYDVACMYPDRRRPISLGDIEAARPICESCTAKGIFRPDAD